MDIDENALEVAIQRMEQSWRDDETLQDGVKHAVEAYEAAKVPATDPAASEVVETLLIYAFLEGYQLGRVRTKPLARGKLIERAVWIKDMMLQAGASIGPIDEAVRRPKDRIAAPPMLILSLDLMLDEIERNCKAAEQKKEQPNEQPVESPEAKNAEAFERWATSEGYDLAIGRCYEDDRAYYAFKGWEARGLYTAQGSSPCALHKALAYAKQAVAHYAPEGDREITLRRIESAAAESTTPERESSCRFCGSRGMPCDCVQSYEALKDAYADLERRYREREAVTQAQLWDFLDEYGLSREATEIAEDMLKRFDIRSRG